MPAANPHLEERLSRRLFEAGRARGVDFREARVVMAAERPSANYAVMRSEGVKEVMKEFGITSYVTVDAGGLESAMVRSRMTAYLVDKDGIGNIDRLSPMMVR